MQTNANIEPTPARMRPIRGDNRKIFKRARNADRRNAQARKLSFLNARD